jgi:hypothetical protein
VSWASFPLDGRDARTIDNTIACGSLRITRTSEGWQVEVKIKDWAEIVVVE